FSVATFAACTTPPVSSTGAAASQDSVKIADMPPPPQQKNLPLAEGLEMLQNIEQIDFCVPAPLTHFKIDEKAERERARFDFIQKNNAKNTLTVQGFFRSDDLSDEGYFKNYTEGMEEEGKVVTEKKFFKNTNCFYIKGYWSNSYNEKRFVETVWLRPDDLVKMIADISVSDTNSWNKRLPIMVSYDGVCR
ncbi:MAG: hypothetical protein RI894_189, partial [Bacteroidota bacterium]